MKSKVEAQKTKRKESRNLIRVEGGRKMIEMNFQSFLTSE